MVNRGILTLDEFTIKEMRAVPRATGELAGLLRDIGLAAKRVNLEVNKAGLVDILGDTGAINIQGEEVKKLDQYANAQFMGVLKHGISCAGIASEEMAEPVPFHDPISMQSKYVCMFDPLDGSGNIDVNVSIGTIFGIYRRISERGLPANFLDFLQPGIRQVAAGYIIYGSSTVLVYATTSGVNGFTLDPAIGEFCLSHPQIKCPANGTLYSVNHGNFFQFPNGVKNYITLCQQKTIPDGGPYSQRYIGSMVADVHRNLIKGGIFLYPGTALRPEGKLRLMYECNPMAYIVEKAGGMATDGHQRILEKLPETLHERSALFIGSSNMIKELTSLLV